MQFSNTWVAFCREAGIAGQSISAGLDSLRKANYAQTGLYNHAFFNLSIGFERFLKLIFIIDFALSHNGQYPKEDDLRAFGHDVQKLFTHALDVRRRLKDNGDRYEFPQGGIQDAIIKFIGRFAKTTRYYNLDYLSQAKRAQKAVDPIRDWYETVGALILQKHYSAAEREKDQAFAKAMGTIVQDFVLVRHTAEDGGALDTFESASMRTGENKIVQKFGTFYCATIARFLFTLLFDLESEGRHLEDLPALHEFFFPFLNDDRYLLSRKTFPPRGQGR